MLTYEVLICIDSGPIRTFEFFLISDAGIECLDRNLGEDAVDRDDLVGLLLDLGM